MYPRAVRVSCRPFSDVIWRLLIFTADLHCFPYSRAARVHHPL